MHTASVSLAVTPTVVSTLFSHYLNRKPLRQRPTAHLSYDEGLHLIKSFLTFASHHTVEELQAFTSQWVPHPQWVRVKEVEIPAEQLARAAAALEEELGPDGVRRIGGRRWWQWRKPKSALRAEWIEMRTDYQERKRLGGAAGAQKSKRVIFYIHGGAYFFGSVDEHRYQLQRHARKLKGRVFAPRYRLAPQFPFPCGLHDCLAAYMYLLTIQEPNTIVLAGDSAGGGMVVSLLVTLRDQGIPLPAGAVLISPWVDLTHSFPSVARDCPMDYIPQMGFHHKPSPSWPPPSEEELDELKKLANKSAAAANAAVPNADLATSPEQTMIGCEVNAARLSVSIDGKTVELTNQIQLYTTNDLLDHPLVSPVLQPTLGGLPPLLIMVGGGEVLRDEQVYLAHKCADPARYLPPEPFMNEKGMAQLKQYQPTDVQLQVWDDLCHVAPTLSFTRPAKYMFRSVAQFSAWALARAQRTGIDILDDDQISVISTSESETGEDDTDTSQERKQSDKPRVKEKESQGQHVGKAGDPLPPFRAHMIRQRVTRHGDILQLAPAAELDGCRMAREDIGVVKVGPVQRWLNARKQWDNRYLMVAQRVCKRRQRDMVAGYEGFGDGEFPPPSALAGRRKAGADLTEKKKRRSLGLALWSLWGSKHDEEAVNLEQQADREPEVKAVTAAEGTGARPFADIQQQEVAPSASAAASKSRSRSRRRMVLDEHQTEQDGVDENTPVAELLAARSQRDGELHRQQDARPDMLGPNFVPNTGVTGKRPTIDGISVPFSLDRDADTASMKTLLSTGAGSVRVRGMAAPRGLDTDATAAPAPKAEQEPATGAESEQPSVTDEKAERPGMDTFVTASEVPQIDN